MSGNFDGGLIDCLRLVAAGDQARLNVGRRSHLSFEDGGVDRPLHRRHRPLNTCQPDHASRTAPRARGERLCSIQRSQRRFSSRTTGRLWTHSCTEHAKKIELCNCSRLKAATADGTTIEIERHHSIEMSWCERPQFDSTTKSPQMRLPMRSSPG